MARRHRGPGGSNGNLGQRTPVRTTADDRHNVSTPQTPDGLGSMTDNGPGRDTRGSRPANGSVTEGSGSTSVTENPPTPRR